MGPQGPQGEVGPPGPQGPTGEPGAGAIIPFSSGNDILINTRSGGVSGVPAFIGFGGSAVSQNFLESPINLSNERSNFAFIVPRTGRLTSFSALFSTSIPHNFTNTTVTVSAQIFRGSTGNNVFLPLPATLLQLQPNYSGMVPTGSIVYASTDNLNIDLNPNDRLLLVVFVNACGQEAVINLRGFVSAGIHIK
ncbi:MAG TPA: exosporium glycoprotein BclB-related protein [Bacilli bacterium]